MICITYLVLVLGVLKKSTISGYLTYIKPYNQVLLSNLKHVSTIPYYVAIINGIFPKLTFKKETTNPDGMEIKDELILNGMAWAEADDIEYNTIGAYCSMER